MDSIFEQQVRERAYELWLRDGGIHGRADHHWFQAVRDILAATENDAPKAAQTRTRSTARSAIANKKPPRATRKRSNPEPLVAR